MTPQPKQHPRERIKHILDVALMLAETQGYTNVSRDAIARVCGFPSASLISHHMGTMDALRRAMVREAIKRENLPVLAQAIALRDRHARKAPDELKARALATLAV